MIKKENAVKLMKELISNGYEAYMVGGCVRDTLMNRAVNDYDITTNALPEEIMKVFEDYHVIPTGVKHGTVTVVSQGIAFEITTYRVDGDYSDSRRPDSVRYTCELTEDLARRDFTMNAIAMDINGRIIDPFNGKNDIENRIIRCVGEPCKRFTEDALRIMRGVRFASQLGFELEENTKKAVKELKNRLEFVSAERIHTELDKLLCGKHCTDVLLEYSGVLAVFIPETELCVGFDQHSPYHKYTVWEHIARAVGAVPEDDITVKRAMLFHDIGKPLCYTQDETGRGHFKGHADVGAELAVKIMKRLKYDNKSVSDTSTLIRHHSVKLKSDIQVKKLLSQLGDELFFRLLDVKRADNSAKQEFVLAELEGFDKIESYAKSLLNQGACLKISQLAIDGNRLVSIGYSGRAVGEMLSELLELVIEEKLENTAETLADYAVRRLSE